MGITGELVRSVFSKSRSIKSHETNVKNNAVEKKKWKNSVRGFLCGDELFDSVIAEEDSASVKSSEATVTQPVFEEYLSNLQDGYISSEDITRNDSSDQVHSYSSTRIVDQEVAAIIIQSAFRGFMVRRLMMGAPTGVSNDFFRGLESPSRESMATSIEVQTGQSVGAVSIQEDTPFVCTKLQPKPKPLIIKPKDNWDDSTVDSSVSRMRIQNRLEAMTRRERALAYAFSQQLRICSKKKQTKCDSTEPNTGWSWLERWMATRQPDILSVEDHISKQLSELNIAMKARPISKKFLDLSFEEKESCGSNEVPIQLDSATNPNTEDKDSSKTPRNRLKAPRNISRRKTVPTHHYQKEHSKVKKGVESRLAEQDKRQKVKQSGSRAECKDDASLLSADDSVSIQNSKI